MGERRFPIFPFLSSLPRLYLLVRLSLPDQSVALTKRHQAARDTPSLTDHAMPRGFPTFREPAFVLQQPTLTENKR